MKYKHIRIIFWFLLIMPLTGFKPFKGKNFVCVSSYTVFNATSNKTITSISFNAWGQYTTPPNDNWQMSFTSYAQIYPNNSYCACTTNPYEFGTPQNTKIFICRIYTNSSFQGTTEMYLDGALVKSITDGASTTEHILVYKIPYGCQTVQIILHD